MTKIDKQGLLQRLVSQTQGVKQGAATSAGQKGATAAGGGASSSDRLSFQERVAIGMAGIDPTTANSTQKALEVYVGAALLDAFGAELVNDPAFAHLLSDVLAGLALSPDYASFTEFVQTELANVKR